MLELQGIDGLKEMTGRELGGSNWLTVEKTGSAS